MLTLDDKITVALAGPIKSGKGRFARSAIKHKDTLLSCLDGNFWVPHQLTTVEEQLDPDLFERYSTYPQQYAFQYQMWCLAQRLRQQSMVDASSGLVLLGQPLEIDRAVFAEANRDNLGNAMAIYELLSDEISPRVESPDIWIYFRIPPDKIDVLLHRIEKEGRAGEKKFLEDSSYLQRNVELNEKFFKDAKFPVIEIDATHPVFGGEENESYFKELIAQVASKIKSFKPPLKLTLDEWTAIDYNQAQKAVREAERQLREYLTSNLRCITVAGLPGTGKTGFAEMLGEHLGIEVMKELSGKGNRVHDPLLLSFLWDKKTYCHQLQKALGPVRIGRRIEYYARRKSFVEDRSPEEDQAVFHRRFLEQGYLTQEQFDELREEAIARYREAPKSDLFIHLERSSRDARRMILGRGRREEFMAWREDELEAMKKYDRELFKDVDALDANNGSKITFDLEELNTKNRMHLGYILQEILFSMKDYDALKAT